MQTFWALQSFSGLKNTVAKYFHNKIYRIDIHSVAQSIITLLAFKDFDGGNVDLAQTIFKWAMNNMWDVQGYFYYQIQPYYKNKIPYMRWSQAWMLLALATLLEQKDSSPQSRRERRGG